MLKTPIRHAVVMNENSNRHTINREFRQDAVNAFMRTMKTGGVYNLSVDLKE